VRLNDYLAVQTRDGKPTIVCRCDYAIGPATDNYKMHLTPTSSPVAKAGPHVNPFGIGDGRFILREFACPACHVLLDVEVVLQDEPPRWDLQPVPGT
jgi:acetone carboxylase gamma subunit